MKRTPLILAVIAFMAVVGCTKEINSDSLNSVNSSSAENSTVVTNTYLPLTKGTFWSYQVINNTGSLDTNRQTVLGISRVIKSKTYQAVKSVTNGNIDTTYYTQNVHDYYLYKGQSNSSGLEVLFLKDNAAVGTKWSGAAGSSGGVNIKYSGKIIATNMTIKVGNVTYTNVIHSYIELSQKILITSILISKQDFYVAKNIGIVKNVTNVVFPSSATVTTNLINYSIK